jgi:hypothetical protein
MSGSVCFEPISKSALYPGTTSVVPLKFLHFLEPRGVIYRASVLGFALYQGTTSVVPLEFLHFLEPRGVIYRASVLGFALYQGTTSVRAAGVSTFSRAPGCDLSSFSVGFCFVSGHDFSRAEKGSGTRALAPAAPFPPQSASGSVRQLNLRGGHYLCSIL